MNDMLENQLEDGRPKTEDGRSKTEVGSLTFKISGSNLKAILSIAGRRIKKSYISPELL